MAGGDFDEALASLPTTRTALHSDHSILLAQADELEARIRLALGDTHSARRIAARLSHDRQAVILALVQLQADHPDWSQLTLDPIPEVPSTVRARQEWQLLHAEMAVRQHSDQASRLIRELLDVVERHGFIQTVLDTAPQLAEYLMSDWDLYPAQALSPGPRRRGCGSPPTEDDPSTRWESARPPHQSGDQGLEKAGSTAGVRRYRLRSPTLTQYGENPPAP